MHTASRTGILECSQLLTVTKMFSIDTALMHSFLADIVLVATLSNVHPDTWAEYSRASPSTYSHRHNPKWMTTRCRLPCSKRIPIIHNTTCPTTNTCTTVVVVVCVVRISTTFHTADTATDSLNSTLWPYCNVVPTFPGGQARKPGNHCPHPTLSPHALKIQRAR